MRARETGLLQRGGIALAAYAETGRGQPFVFQHGLLGDIGQTAELAGGLEGWRLATVECRGHGQSPLGNPDLASIATFSADVAAFGQESHLFPCALGGISMGAAIALRLAVQCPAQVRALVLVRPAWVCEGAPENMRPNALVGDMIAQGGRVAEFDATATAAELQRSSPDNLASLRSFFARVPSAETSLLLTRISDDGPGVSRADLAGLDIPALVIGCAEDHIHPLDHAETLAALLPRGRFVEVPPKGRDRAAHVAAVRAAIAGFLAKEAQP